MTQPGPSDLSPSIRHVLTMTVLAATLALAGCGSEAPGHTPTAPVQREPTSQNDTVDPDVAATVEQVLSLSEHPSLKWPRIPDVVPILQPLYAGEPDRLFWFERGAPVPALKPTLAALSAAAGHGLDPFDYDAAWLEQ